ncbi:MAG: high-potential iron-sulfur protein [Vulcanimicrobiaceae bacterium]
MNDTDKLSRKDVLQGLVVLPALAALWASGAAPARAGKGSKAQFKYQTTPNNGNRCSKCSLFIAGSSATANGTCKVVDGSISPNGWCIAFSAKS